MPRTLGYRYPVFESLTSSLVVERSVYFRMLVRARGYWWVGVSGHLRFEASEPAFELKSADFTLFVSSSRGFMVNTDYGLHRHLYGVKDRESRIWVTD